MNEIQHRGAKLALKAFAQHFGSSLPQKLPQIWETAFGNLENESKKGKYQSLTITFTAQSRQQMDDIYQSLSDSEHVVMSL